MEETEKHYPDHPVNDHVDNISTDQKDLPKGLAIASMVCGILQIFCCGITCLPAIILSIIALVKCKNGTGGGKGFAIAGLVLSILYIVFGIVYGLIVGFAEALNSANYMY